MCYGWRVFAADEIEHKVERRNDDKSPNACDPENNLREFHIGVSPQQRERRTL
jgi:hypothetical protein